MTQPDERRSFIRHPVDVPIQIYPQLGPLLSEVQMRDVGKGGLAFRTNVALDSGMLLTLVIPHVHPPFEETGVVCWCQPDGDSFEVGVRFVDQEVMFKARMVEQICYIEEYRRRENGRGRRLSLEESAREWVNKYAADFGLN
ncbi:PilZ domain-containing protein [Mariprofundus erugo]|uniref:PilZ domain-containing protein n=1 Tax=Mariprofundus erugo TaxID=2528639 RepID=A0A5R9GMY4_9PROT|nr:PilZ domain-containing protein [Mariprofundus erugo]TLS65647.1 PilZ domain-containing protein [Mariprofundus erugo]TLS75656.1 PilZ domain-containing protein [Mariprofundus erugo]